MPHQWLLRSEPLTIKLLMLLKIRSKRDKNVRKYVKMKEPNTVLI